MYFSDTVGVALMLKAGHQLWRWLRCRTEIFISGGDRGVIRLD